MKMECASILLVLIAICSLASGQRNTADELIREGSDLLAKGEYDHALVDFDKALSMDSSSPEAWHGKGYALNGLGCNEYEEKKFTDATAHFEEAKECLEKAIQLNSSFYLDAYIDLAFSENMLNNPDKALELIDRAIKIYPNNAEAINLKGTILYRQSKYDEAIKFYREAARKDPENFNAWWDLCDVLKNQKKGDPNFAEETSTACQNVAAIGNAQVGHGG